MSQAVSYTKFCAIHELNPQLDSSKEQYKAYSNNLDMFADNATDKNWGTLSEIIEFLDEKDGNYDLEHIKVTIMTVLRNNY